MALLISTGIYCLGSPSSWAMARRTQPSTMPSSHQAPMTGIKRESFRLGPFSLAKQPRPSLSSRANEELFGSIFVSGYAYATYVKGTQAMTSGTRSSFAGLSILVRKFFGGDGFTRAAPPSKIDRVVRRIVIAPIGRRLRGWSGAAEARHGQEECGKAEDGNIYSLKQHGSQDKNI